MPLFVKTWTGASNLLNGLKSDRAPGTICARVCDRATKLVRMAARSVALAWFIDECPLLRRKVPYCHDVMDISFPDDHETTDFERRHEHAAGLVVRDLDRGIHADSPPAFLTTSSKVKLLPVSSLMKRTKTESSTSLKSRETRPEEFPSDSARAVRGNRNPLSTANRQTREACPLNPGSCLRGLLQRGLAHLPGVFPQSFCEKALSLAILDELVHF